MGPWEQIDPEVRVLQPLQTSVQRQETLAAFVWTPRRPPAQSSLSVHATQVAQKYSSPCIILYRYVYIYIHIHLSYLYLSL